MCLGEVGRVQHVIDRGLLSIELNGHAATVSAMLLDAPPAVGEWVVIHAGYALGTLTETEACAALEMRRAARETG